MPERAKLPSQVKKLGRPPASDVGPVPSSTGTNGEIASTSGTPIDKAEPVRNRTLRPRGLVGLGFGLAVVGGLVVNFVTHEVLPAEKTTGVSMSEQQLEAIAAAGLVLDITPPEEQSAELQKYAALAGESNIRSGGHAAMLDDIVNGVYGGDENVLDSLAYIVLNQYGRESLPTQYAERYPEESDPVGNPCGRDVYGPLRRVLPQGEISNRCETLINSAAAFRGAEAAQEMILQRNAFLARIDELRTKPVSNPEEAFVVDLRKRPAFEDNLDAVDQVALVLSQQTTD